MNAMPWVKIKTGFLRDEKIHFIVKKYGHDSIVFWTGLLTECRRGVLEMPDEIFAEICIMDIQRLEELKKVFIKLELVTQCNGGKLTVKNWSKYQYSDSYERVKAHRIKSVTTCNENETDKKHFVTTEVEEEVEVDSEGEVNTTAANEKISLSTEGLWQNISPETRAAWERAYPALSLDTELARAAAWILTNPQNRKKNYARFLTNWLSRSQDRAPRVNQPVSNQRGFTSTTGKIGRALDACRKAAHES